VAVAVAVGMLEAVLLVEQKQEQAMVAQLLLIVVVVVVVVIQMVRRVRLADLVLLSYLFQQQVIQLLQLELLLQVAVTKL
jgi:hypothetical protein